MAFEDDLKSVIRDMSESEAKTILYRVFVRMSRVNGVSYTKEQCYKDIDEIYSDVVVGEMIFGDKKE